MADEHARLINTGVHIQNRDRIPQPQVDGMTLLVLGAPRGGTSALAGLLAELGVFMGHGASAPVYEGLKLAKAMEDERREDVRALIEEYDQLHKVWAHKRPGFTRIVADYHPLFRNPVYLVIFRDPIATASRGMISGRLKGNFLKKLRQILEKYEGIIQFTEASGAPAVFISYEKLLQEPEAVVTDLMQALHLSPPPDQLARAISFVEPSPEAYLEVSRATRCSGAWIDFNEQSISGWAEYVNKTMTNPPRVVLFDGDRELARAVANSHCHAGQENSVRGFEFKLRELGIAASPTLRVRVHGEIRDLPRPPFRGRRRLRYRLSALATGLGLKQSNS